MKRYKTTLAQRMASHKYKLNHKNHIKKYNHKRYLNLLKDKEIVEKLKKYKE